MTIDQLSDQVRISWKLIPTPPAKDMKYMALGWGEKADKEFVGIAPTDVNIASEGFYAATPLLDLPPKAAAAYLGTYILSLLKNLKFQESTGLFSDIFTRAHTLTCLKLPRFWQEVIRPCLPRQCVDVLKNVVDYLVSKHEALSLTEQQCSIMIHLASES